MKSRVIIPLLLVSSLFALSGCGLFFGGSDAADEAAAVTPVLAPTFTPTPPGAAPAPTPTIAFDAPPAGAAAPAAVAAAPVTASDTAPVTVTAPVTTAAPVTAAVPVTAAAAAPTATAAVRPKLIVQQDGINVRQGPGVNFGIGGTANTGQEFDIIAKSQAGDWWQVCCVNGEPVWIFGQLATVQNTESVQVNESIAAAPAPVAAAPAAPAVPAPAPAAPAAPAPAPEQPTPAPAPPPADNPCAGIGGDGCKFKVRGGPAFAPNSNEIKLTLGFIHSGIDGGQPQGSYFVVLLKDGQNLNVPDSVRSFDPSINQMQGPNGQYNYEYKIPLDKIPGGTVAGNYTIWVLDGNGERDSQNVNFAVPDGQGEVWIQFDQG